MILARIGLLASMSFHFRYDFNKFNLKHLNLNWGFLAGKKLEVCKKDFLLISLFTFTFCITLTGFEATGISEVVLTIWPICDARLHKWWWRWPHSNFQCKPTLEQLSCRDAKTLKLYFHRKEISIFARFKQEKNSSGCILQRVLCPTVDPVKVPVGLSVCNFHFSPGAKRAVGILFILQSLPSSII